jgi:hypothetical protein
MEHKLHVLGETAVATFAVVAALATFVVLRGLPEFRGLWTSYLGAGALSIAAGVMAYCYLISRFQTDRSS